MVPLSRPEAKKDRESYSDASERNIFCKIVAALDNAIQHGNMDRMAAIRRNKRTL